MKTMQQYQLQMMTMMMDYMNKVMQMMTQMVQTPFMPQMPFMPGMGQMPQTPSMEQLFHMPFMKMFNIPGMNAEGNKEGFPFFCIPKQVLQQLLHMEASPDELAMLQQFLDRLFELYSRQE